MRSIDVANAVAVLDACVLFPASLRDTLLRVAAAGLYQLQWTDDILEEVRRNLVAKREITEKQAKGLVDTIKEYFPEARVTQDYNSLIETMTNDPKDRHVLAAAVASGSQTIVTFNLHDFPAQALTPFGIEVQMPDDFLTTFAQFDLQQMIDIVEQQAQDLRNPSKTVPNLLDTLAQHVPTFATLIRAGWVQSSHAP
jgi:predicted nucleic acid-binding protein